MMKKKALPLSMLCALLSQATFVNAEEISVPEKPIFESGFFIGTKTSYQQSVDNSLDNNPSSIGYGFFGGYQINKNWSWDLGYQSLGKLETEDVAVANSFIESAFKYNYFFNEKSKWSGYGRLGFARWNVTKTSMGIEDSADGFSPLLEVGFDYALTSNWVGNVGYQYISSIGDDNTGQMDSHALMFGLKYQFTGKSKQKNTALAEQQRKAEEAERQRQAREAELQRQAEKAQEQSKANEAKLKRQIEAEKKKRLQAEQALKKANQLNEDVKVLESKKITARFNSGSSVLAKEDKQKLQKDLSEVNELMEQFPQSKVYVVGHTDSSGSAKYNLWISEKRAQTISKELQKQGVANDRITVKGMGETSATGVNNPKDRRVDLVITCDDCIK